MDDQDDPYSLLGVSRDATQSQIKTAYRKAALKYHPDKVSSGANPQEIATANLLFSKISNAYELLSDEQKRAEFDRSFYYQPQQQQPQQQQQHYPFPSQQQQQQQYPFHHPFHFHDPFEVFRRVFQEEFNLNPAGSRGGGFRRDPLGHDFFQNDDFFFGGDPFFGRSSSTTSRMPSFGNSSIFGHFDNMFESMNREMQNSARNIHNNPNNYSVYSSSSSTTYGGNDGQSTVTVTKRIVNGKEEVITERILRKPDGTIERTVQNHSPAALDAAPQPGYLPWTSTQQQQEQQQPPSNNNHKRRSSKRSETEQETRRSRRSS